MRPVAHLAISGAAGAIGWAVSGSPAAIGASVVAGVLVDLDHMVDYVRWYGLGKQDELLLLLHAWEWAAALLVLSVALFPDPVVVGATFGYCGHLVADQFGNHAYPLTYSITYRIANRFMLRKVAPWTVDGSRKAITASLPSAGGALLKALDKVRLMAKARG